MTAQEFAGWKIQWSNDSTANHLETENQTEALVWLQNTIYIDIVDTFR